MNSWFSELKVPEVRLLALAGLDSAGVDPAGIIHRPVTVIQRRHEEAYREFISILEEHEVDDIIGALEKLGDDAYYGIIGVAKGRWNVVTYRQRLGELISGFNDRFGLWIGTPTLFKATLAKYETRFVIYREKNKIAERRAIAEQIPHLVPSRYGHTVQGRSFRPFETRTVKCSSCEAQWRVYFGPGGDSLWHPDNEAALFPCGHKA